MYLRGYGKITTDRIVWRGLVLEPRLTLAAVPKKYVVSESSGGLTPRMCESSWDKFSADDALIAVHSVL